VGGVGGLCGGLGGVQEIWIAVVGFTLILDYI